MRPGAARSRLGVARAPWWSVFSSLPQPVLAMLVLGC
jgi:hypothetical protein